MKKLTILKYQYFNRTDFRKYFLLFTLISIGKCFAQEYKLPEIVPPSPTSFEFASYGNIPMNGSTGGFSYSVPLFNLSEGDIKVNTQLSYYSSGVKIDKLSTELGVDWNLIAGGVITRVVRDDPDEEAQYRWYPQSINPSEDYSKIKSAANDYNFDTEPDWFSFNVNGISGEFYLDENLGILINSEQHLIITKNADFTTFELIDDKGFKYKFGGVGAIETNLSSNDCDSASRRAYKTSWFLKSITSPKGNILTFQYVDSSYRYITSVNNTLLFDEDCYCGPSNTTYTYNHSKCISYSFINTKLLSKIVASNGYIEFEYESGRSDISGQSGNVLKKITKYSSKGENDSYELNYENTISGNHKDAELASNESLKYRFFLSEIVHSDNFGQKESKYRFEYAGKDQLPCRLSYSQDKYGYHNNSNNYKAFSNPEDPGAYAVASKYAPFLIGANKDVNPSFTHYGMLSKIIHPTKGETVINYEANSDRDFVESNVVNSKNISLSKGCNTLQSTSESFTFISNGTPINYSLNATIDTYICNSERDALHDKYNLQIKDLTAGSEVRNFSRPEGSYVSTDSYLNCSINSTDVYSPVCTIAGHEYEVTFTISSRFSQISGSLNLKYNKSKEMVEKTIYGGGARVGQIYDYSGGKIVNRRTIYYNRLSSYPNDNTSLNKVYDPEYSQFSSFWKNCMTECCSSLVGVSLEYKACAMDVESYNASDKNRYFISHNNLNSLYNNRKQNVYYDAITTMFIDEGNNSYNGAEERLFHVIGDAPPGVLNAPEIPGVPSSNNSDMYYGQLDELNIYKYSDVGYSKIKSTIWNYEVLENRFRRSHSFRKNYDFTLIGVTEQNVDNISISFYQNYMYKKRLRSVETIDFKENGQIIKTHSYKYGEEPYYSMIEVLSETSNANEQFLEKYLYPQYKSSPSALDQLMIEENLTSFILSTEKFKVKNGTENFLQSIKNNFQIFNEGQVLLESNDYIKSNSQIEKFIKYHRYDDHGNPLEITKIDGPPIIFLWGYNDQYPIAQIENATYADVASNLGQTLSTLETNITEQNMVQVNNLRLALPNAMVTTYTYEPLVGVTSITDPKGLTTYYTYDALNRLEFIKDQNQNIIKEYDYYYKSQN